MASPRPATVLHTSDVHLDRNDGGRPQRAFAAAVDLAIELNVHAVLVVGDLFDHAGVGDDLLAWTADQLDRLNRPVVLLVGNHDALHARSVHHRFDAPNRCKQVLFLDEPDGSIVEIPDTDVVVWGRAMVEHDPSFYPLAGSPPRRKDAWNVIAGHGLMVDGTQSRRSSPIFARDLDELDCDYVALGHLHEFGVLRNDPLSCYPGATGSSRGGRAGCVIVQFEPGQATGLRWAPLLPD